MSRRIIFVTSNKHKFAEAQSILKRLSINIEKNLSSVEEIRSESCEEVSASSAARAFEKIQKPLIAEDSGLFIDCLNGFPGAYSAWAFGKLGLAGILRLAEGWKSRPAKYVSSVAYADENGVKTFTGECAGKIAGRISGKKGFGYDPIFIPKGSTKTFGEDDSKKSEISHRAKALGKFASWFNKNQLD